MESTDQCYFRHIFVHQLSHIYNEIVFYIYFMCLVCIIQVIRVKLSKEKQNNVLSVEIRDSINIHQTSLGSISKLSNRSIECIE